MLPENAPVRRTGAQLEKLDYRELYKAYSSKGRKSVVNPIDGTKMESRAGRYTFCRRGSIKKDLAKVKADVLKQIGLKALKGLNKTEK